MFAADTDDPIVITGVGVVSPLGSTREAAWSGLLAGRSAARRL
jgi:3-oxoacyl-(acyl-carrier-protein) synthase